MIRQFCDNVTSCSRPGERDLYSKKHKGFKSGTTVSYYTITLRIQAVSLVESHDLLEDRRTKLRHTKAISFPYLYRSCTRDICKILTFSNYQMFGWIKSKLFTCLIQDFSCFINSPRRLVSHFLFFPHYHVILCFYYLLNS